MTYRPKTGPLRRFTANTFASRGVGCREGLQDYRLMFPNGQGVNGATFRQWCGPSNWGLVNLMAIASPWGRRQLRDYFGQSPAQGLTTLAQLIHEADRMERYRADRGHADSPIQRASTSMIINEQLVKLVYVVRQPGFLKPAGRRHS